MKARKLCGSELLLLSTLVRQERFNICASCLLLIASFCHWQKIVFFPFEKALYLHVAVLGWMCEVSDSVLRIAPLYHSCEVSDWQCSAHSATYPASPLVCHIEKFNPDESPFSRLLTSHAGKKCGKFCGSELLLCQPGSARIQLLQLHVCSGVPVYVLDCHKVGVFFPFERCIGMLLSWAQCVRLVTVFCVARHKIQLHTPYR